MSRPLCILAAVVFFLAPVSRAQEFRGSLSGRVIDQQQAAVSNAKILATHNDTGAKSQTVAGVDGSYTLPYLPPGPYTLTAEAKGFKRYVNANIRVTTWDQHTIEAKVITTHYKIGENGIRVEERQNGDSVEIDVRYPHHVANR